MRVRGYTDATYGTVVDSLNTAESAYQPLTIASSTLRLNDLTNGAIVTGTGTFTISGTTASTSTSTGALVVSGGVGVAGAMYVGSAGTFNGTVRVSTGNGTAATFSLVQAGQQQWAAEIPASSTNLRLRAVDAAVDALTLGTNGNLTGAGSITTAAPTGGTAAAWKLGTVATVSPTSPNRTIEVDIGGTIYYIHAKTTNN